MSNQHKGVPTVENYIASLLSSQFLNCGEQFTTVEAASFLSSRKVKVERHTAYKIMREMEQRGHVSAIEYKRNGTKQFDWRKRRPSMNLARMAWRKFSNEDLGLEVQNA